MAGKRVLVLGRFRGGIRQRDIHAQLKAQGHRLTTRVHLAEVVIAGTRCGARLEAARQAGLTVLDQDAMVALTTPSAPASPATPAVKPAAKPAPTPTAKPAPPRPRRVVAPEPVATDPAAAIRQLATVPMTESAWWQIGQLFKTLPEDTIAGLVDEIEPVVTTWPAHIRGAHSEWLLDLLDGKVDPRLRLVGRLPLSDIIKKGLDKAAVVLDRFADEFPGVRQLRINHFKGNTEWLKLLTPQRMANFTELDLMYNELKVAGLEKILSVIDPAQITLMDLRSNELGANGMKCIAEAGFTSLSWLHLYQNNIKNKGLAHLTKCKALSNISYLSVEYNALDGAAGGLLAKATFAEGLTGLKVKYNNLLAKGGKALANAKTLGNLKLLDISANEIGDEALAAMAHSPHLGAMEDLRIEGNGGNYPLIGDDGVWALADGAGMPKLGALNLQGNQVSESGFGALLRSKNRTALHALRIQNNQLPSSKLDVLMEADLPVKLRDLTISFSDGPLPTFQKLLRNAAAFDSLERLSITPPWTAQMKHTITEALLSNPALANIQDLEIRDFKFNNKTLDMLLACEFPQLRRLNLSSPGFNDAMLAKFMTAPWLQRLEKIVISGYPEKPDYSALKAMFEGTSTVCVAY